MKFPLRPGLGPTTVHRYVLVWNSLPQKSPGIFILNPSKLLAHNLAWSKSAGVDAFDLVVDFFLEGCLTEEVDAFGLQLSVATVCDVGFFADECLVADGAVLVQVDASLEELDDVVDHCFLPVHRMIPIGGTNGIVPTRSEECEWEFVFCTVLLQFQWEASQLERFVSFPLHNFK